MLTAGKVHIPVGQAGRPPGDREQVRGASEATAAACLRRCPNLERGAHRFPSLFPRTMCQIFLLFFEKPVGGHRWEVGSCKGKEDGVGAERTACAPLQARPRGPRWRRSPRSSPPPPAPRVPPNTRPLVPISCQRGARGRRPPTPTRPCTIKPTATAHRAA